MIGPGKYDDVATMAREQAKAAGVILAIIGGQRGSGFSVQADIETALAVPDILRAMADQIERDMKGGRL